MNSHVTKSKCSILFTILLCVLLINGLGYSSAARAESLNFVRSIDTDDLFIRDYFSANNKSLPGIAFPPGAQTLLFFNQSGRARLDLVAPPKDNNSTITRTSIDNIDPINIAFDTRSTGAKGFNLFRLFIWKSDLGQLICIKSGPRNIIKPSSRRDIDLINKVEFQSVGVMNPQGMTLDPATGVLYLLDDSGQQIISIKRKIGRQCKSVEISQIFNVPFPIKGKLRGLAFNPFNKHLYAMNNVKREMYKLSRNGELIASIDLSGKKIGSPRAMIFGPSLDQTDHVSIFHLYLVTTQNGRDEFTEWVLQ